ncbi:MAG: tetratricopeptide repeat protein, partial [Bacteroidetes bacterium]|nr:tetratricopeptide repeat protein [Bacteroidota bacterium]
MKSVFIFSFIFSQLVCCSFIFSQDKEVDSLLVALKHSGKDTNKVEILTKLCWDLRKSEPDKALDYAMQALHLSREINYRKGIALSQNHIGGVYRYKGEYQSAFAYYDSALTIFTKIEDKRNSAASLSNLGLIRSATGDYAVSLDYHLKSLKIRETLNNEKEIAISLVNIGIVYGYQKNSQMALDYYKRATGIFEKINDKNSLGAVLNNIGTIYDDLGNMEEAMQYYQRSLKIREETGDKHGIGGSLINIGLIYFTQKKYSQALDCYEKALKIKTEFGDKRAIAEIYGNLGDLFSQKKEYEKSILYLNDGLKLALEIGSKDDVAGVYKKLSEVYSEKNDFKRAYEYHKLYGETKDSLLNEESSKQITEMQTKYETEKKEQQILLLNKDKELQDAQLNRQKIIIWSVAGGLLVVLILSIFIFRERRKSEKLLLNILPVETARELKANGKATAKHYESVTVMFTDFKNFTGIAEKLSAEELVSELDFLFKKFDEIISKYPIEKIKTIGDAYMCAGGLPTSNTTNAMDVVSAALEIQEWMKSPLLTSPVRGGKKSQVLPNGEDLGGAWQLRIGIHTGPVSAGVVGDKKFAYDIWGD